jgi:hypothetical protein
MQQLIDVFELRYDKSPLFWHPKKEEAPQGEREGPAATLGGGKFLRSALMYVKASHSPTAWQISRGPSCAPAVKKTSPRRVGQHGEASLNPGPLLVLIGPLVVYLG